MSTTNKKTEEVLAKFDNPLEPYTNKDGNADEYCG